MSMVEHKLENAAWVWQWNWSFRHGSATPFFAKWGVFCLFWFHYLHVLRETGLSQEVLLFYTLASLESSMAGIYFVIFVLWSSVFLLLYQSLCYGCLVFFLCQLFWLFLMLTGPTCFHLLSYLMDISAVHTTATECQKQSPMFTHLTCPLEHHQQHTQDPPCAFCMCECVASFSRLVLSITAIPILPPPPASPCLPPSLFHCPLCVRNPVSYSLVTCSPM